MPWGWTPRAASVDNGGAIGTPAEARQTTTWPTYEAQYLHNALKGDRGKYSHELPSQRDAIYLDKVTDNYKEEAEDALKAEFDLWLQGRHPQHNDLTNNTYENEPHKPTRKHVYGPEAGTVRDDWNHTDWGQKQLTHLPGVREYLRGQALRANSADVQMNLLAEHGPQDIEEAWMYFKHWVKGRPSTEGLHVQGKGDSIRSNFGPQQPVDQVTVPMPPQVPVVPTTPEAPMTPTSPVRTSDPRSKALVEQAIAAARLQLAAAESSTASPSSSQPAQAQPRTVAAPLSWPEADTEVTARTERAQRRGA